METFQVSFHVDSGSALRSALGHLSLFNFSSGRKLFHRTVGYVKDHNKLLIQHRNGPFLQRQHVKEKIISTCHTQSGVASLWFTLTAASSIFAVS